MKPITQLAATFEFQSYFDDTLLSNAILAQANGNPIVDSTKQTSQTPGRGLALHPSSHAPVAVRFKGGDNADSSTIVLTPGQKVMVGPFDQFDWGLPFGWLGGGRVVLYVIHGNESDIVFPQTHNPVVFHRQRLSIQNAPVAAPGTPNWPMTVPWSNANRSVSGNLTPQQASGLFPIIPERVVFYYRGAPASALPIDLLLEIINPTAFTRFSMPDQNSGVPGYSNGVLYFPFTVSAIPAPGPNVAAVGWLPPEVNDLAGENAAVYVVDPAGALGGQKIDVVRYGRFM